MSEVCKDCNKPRGKQAKPWRSCIGCSKKICFTCCRFHVLIPQCSECWKIEQAEKERQRLSTPVNCEECNEPQLPSEFANASFPSVCLGCTNKRQSIKEQQDTAAQPFLIRFTKTGNPAPFDV